MVKKIELNLIRNIKECSLFFQFKDNDIDCLLNSRDVLIKSYAKDDLLFSEGELCNFLSIILEGSIEIQKLDPKGNLLVVATLNKGNVFGENLLFGDKNHYPMSVVSKEKSKVLHIKKSHIYNLCYAKEIFLKELLRLLSNKALNLSSKLKEVSMKSIREMICAYILTRYEREGSLKIELDFSRKSWAERLGVQRPSLSRELIKMRKLGLIDFSKNIIEIKDLDALKSSLS